jgi:hypothetical protein
VDVNDARGSVGSLIRSARNSIHELDTVDSVGAQVTEGADISHSRAVDYH